MQYIKALIDLIKTVKLLVSLFQEGRRLILEQQLAQRQAAREEALKKIEQAKTEQEEKDAFRDLINNRK